MARVAFLAVSIALLAGCAQSDEILGPVPGGSIPTSVGTSSTSGTGGDAGDAGDGGDDSSDGGSDAAAPSQTSSPAATGTGGDAGEGGGGGGLGGGAACGDGSVALGEECDDANAIVADGCTACLVDCEPEGTKDLATGHCYRVFDDATTWPNAEANCAAWGGSPGLGHLASIADDIEQDLVFGLITQQTWVGIQDPITEGIYQWSDATPWAYTHWAPGEPDNTYEEDCAFMRTTDDGGWNDHACGDIRPSYVCERGAAGTPGDGG